MANFWDLPRPVRDRIYRLHLVQDDPITTKRQIELAQTIQLQGRYHHQKRVPPICAISRKADREAAPIFYGENHFVFGTLKDGSDSHIVPFSASTWTRHLRMIHKVTIQWPKPMERYFAWGGMAREAFLEIGRMTGLQELYIRVDEAAMVRDMLWSRRPRRPNVLSIDTPLSRQDNLAISRHPGMTGLLTLHGIPHVEFTKHWNLLGNETGGPIPGGVLETEILPKLKGPKRQRLGNRPSNCSFPFFDLPPELRNRIYSMLLHIEGPLEPSPRPPSSAPKKCSSGGHLPPPGSALNILAVDRQIHDEAVGIFYHANQFLFRTPPQLAAFVVTLGDVRASSLRDVTLHYENSKSGGIELASITLPMLKRLTGLRKLHILTKCDVVGRLYTSYVNGRWPYAFDLCNPVKLPGVRALFDLRGITDIKFSDTILDESIERLKRDKLYPDGFDADSTSSAHIKVDRIMKHFNAALADAQVGKVNMKLLADDSWPDRDEFPEIEEVLKEASTVAENAGSNAEASKDIDQSEGQMEDEMSAQSEGETDAELGAQTTEQTEAEVEVEVDIVVVASNTRGGSTRYSLRRSRDEVGDSAAEDDKEAEAEAEENRDDAPAETENEVPANQDEAGDEIVVKHVARPKSTTAGVTDCAGGDEAEVTVKLEDEDVMEEPSYATRGRSVEL